MYIEQFDGGILYKGAIDTDRAHKAARIARAFLRYDASLFFKPPINDVLDSYSRVMKAWVQYPQGSKLYPSIENDYIDCEGGWGKKAVEFLTTLANDVDALTHIESDTRFIQIYMPESMIAAHTDKVSSKIIGLVGQGIFKIHDPINNDVILQKVLVEEGDVLQFHGVGMHSAVNCSPIQPRYTLGLIDK